MTPLARAEDSLLLLIDLQDRLLGAISPDVRHALIHQAGMLAQAARLLDIPVLHTEQHRQGLGPTTTALQPFLDTPAIDKTQFSCCGVSGVDAALASAKRRCIVIAGVEAHICVLQTALQLQAAGHAVFVVEDAVASRNDAHKTNALARLHQAGIIISNVESTLFEWLVDAGHPAFKSISALIR